MDQDPYSSLIDLGRRMASDPPLTLEETSAKEEGAAARLREGKVKSVKPLTVTAAGLTLPTKSLRVNERLTKGAKWRFKIKSKQQDFRAGTSDTVEDAQAEQLELDLEQGDRVLMLTMDDQTFYILMKVVDAV